MSTEFGSSLPCPSPNKKPSQQDARRFLFFTRSQFRSTPEVRSQSTFSLNDDLRATVSLFDYRREATRDCIRRTYHSQELIRKYHRKSCGCGTHFLKVLSMQRLITAPSLENARLCSSFLHYPAPAHAPRKPRLRPGIHALHPWFLLSAQFADSDPRRSDSL